MPGSKPLDLTLALTSGIDVVGRLLDPVGRPLSGGIASGEVFEGAWYPIQGETFRVEGYYPDRPRELFFFHKAQNLAGHYLLKGTAAEGPGNPARATAQSAGGCSMFIAHRSRAFNCAARGCPTIIPEMRVCGCRPMTRAGLK